MNRVSGAPATESQLDRLAIYSLTARGLMLGFTLLLAFSMLSGFLA